MKSRSKLTANLCIILLRFFNYDFLQVFLVVFNKTIFKQVIVLPDTKRRRLGLEANIHCDQMS